MRVPKLFTQSLNMACLSVLLSCSSPFRGKEQRCLLPKHGPLLPPALYLTQEPTQALEVWAPDSGLLRGKYKLTGLAQAGVCLLIWSVDAAGKYTVVVSP